MTKAKATPAKARKATPAKGKAKTQGTWTKIPGDTPVGEVVKAFKAKPKKAAPKTAAKKAPAPTVFAKTGPETTGEKPGNRDEKGRQVKGAPSLNPNGRPKGSRHKLAQDFIRVLANDFAKHGEVVIETLRLENPAAYAKTISGVLPKVIEVEDDEDDAGGKAVSGVILITRDRIRSLIGDGQG